MLYNFIYKTFGFLINIDVIIFFLILAAAVFLALQWQVATQRTLYSAILLLLVVVVMPFGRWAGTFLENRTQRLEELPQDVKGLILLGGMFDIKMSEALGRPSYNGAGGRLTEFVELALKHPNLPILFTGGGKFQSDKYSEAQFARDVIVNLGIDAGRLILEDKSKNTIENAKLSLEIVKPKAEDKWALVTSAVHMPRAYLLFKKAGWNVVPYPVDYHTSGKYDCSVNFSMFQGFFYWWHSMREWAGLVGNYLFGNTDQLLP